MFGLVPLDNVILQYSITDIWHILTSSIEFNVTFFTGIAVALIMISALVILNKKTPSRRFALAGLMAFGCSIVLFLYRGEIVPPPSHFASGIQYNTAINKTSYFISKLYSQNSSNELDTTLSIFDIKTIQKNYPNARFVNDSFPFLRLADSTSTLAPYFSLKKDSMPNIVLIITESLSGVVASPDATLGSYTPFLDSLAKQGLYWNNCISTSERTINAPSSILGSLPSANGFASLSGEMPFHFSLISILNKINYQSSFFYGGDLRFDNLHDFVNYQGFDSVLGGQFSSENNEITWGTDDEDIFAKDKIKPSNTRPSVKVFLTISTHGPYTYKNQEKYKNLYNLTSKHYSANKDMVFSVDQRKNCEALLYTDNAIRQYINTCKQTKAFSNTIFIIVGDHTHGLFATLSDIEKYHVPLIIYSPLLKKTHQSKAIVSHLDIAPSLLTLLKTSYHIPKCDTVHWLGQQLDTSTYFKASKKQAFLSISRQINDYLSDSLFYSNGRLYKVHNNLHLQSIQNDSITKRMEHELAVYRKINYYVCHQNRLYPKHFSDEQLLSVGVLHDSTIYENEFIDLPSIKIDQANGKYKVMLRGEIFLPEIKQCPKFVLQPINKEGKAIYSQVADFKTIDWSPLKPNTWQIIQTSHTATFKNGECIDGSLFSYIWNSSRTKVKYRNLVITIYKAKRGI